MLQYERINISEGIDINKLNKSKECMIYHCWYFNDIGFKFESYFSNKCHDISMMADEFKNTAMVIVKGVYYRCILWNMTKNDGINRLYNFKSDNKGKWRIEYEFWWKRSKLLLNLLWCSVNKYGVKWGTFCENKEYINSIDTLVGFSGVLDTG